MASYSVAQAKNELPQLINRAEAGEDVVITRRGIHVASIVGAAAAVHAAKGDVLERMRQLREAGPVLQTTAVKLLNDMYEDDR